MSHKAKASLGWVALVGVAALWWWPGLNFINHPYSYRPVVAFGLLVLIAATFHVRAYIRYARIAGHVEDAHEAGVVTSVDLLVARNQRFRYQMRLVEAALAFALVVLGFISVHHPAILLNVNYSKVILTYLLGSVALTGYLSHRDNRVLDRQQQMRR